MANSANLEQSHSSAHFPYLKFDFNLTQDIVQENYSKNPTVATMQKVARVSVVGLVLVALFETLKNGAKLLANALIFLANCGYDLNASLANRKVEKAAPQIEMSPEQEPSPATVRMNFMANGKPVVFPAFNLLPTIEEGVEEPENNDAAPAAPSVPSEPASPVAANPVTPSTPDASEIEIPVVSNPFASDAPVEAPAPAAEKKEENPDMEKLTRAAVSFQKVWRGRKARKELASQNEAATTIQRAWRGHRARKQLALQNKAATDIQRVWRGHRARKEVAQMRAANAAAQPVLKQEPQKASGKSSSIWNWFKRSA